MEKKAEDILMSQEAGHPYYEEKIIDGILCYRDAPSCNFKPFTKRELTDKINRFKRLIRILQSDRT